MSEYLKKYEAEMKISAAFLLAAFFILLSSFSGNAQDSLVIRGQLSPVSKATLSSSLSSFIKSMKVSEGQQFKKGDILYELDCKIFDAQKDQALSAIKLAEEQLSSVKTLLSMNGASQIEVAEAEASVASAQAQLRMHMAILEGCVVRAPYDGRVMETYAKQLEYVQQGVKVLSILSHKDLELEVLIPSAMLKTITIGTDVNFSVDELGIAVTAKVSAIGSYVDATSRTIKIKAKLSAWNDKLLAGMSGFVTFPTLQ